jgi:hypothetical protein
MARTYWGDLGSMGRRAVPGPYVTVLQKFQLRERVPVPTNCMVRLDDDTSSNIEYNMGADNTERAVEKDEKKDSGNENTSESLITTIEDKREQINLKIESYLHPSYNVSGKLISSLLLALGQPLSCSAESRSSASFSHFPSALVEQYMDVLLGDIEINFDPNTNFNLNHKPPKSDPGTSVLIVEGFPILMDSKSSTSFSTDSKLTAITNDGEVESEPPKLHLSDPNSDCNLKTSDDELEALNNFVRRLQLVTGAIDGVRADAVKVDSLSAVADSSSLSCPDSSSSRSEDIEDIRITDTIEEHFPCPNSSQAEEVSEVMLLRVLDASARLFESLHREGLVSALCYALWGDIIPNSSPNLHSECSKSNWIETPCPSYLDRLLRLLAHPCLSAASRVKALRSVQKICLCTFMPVVTYGSDNVKDWLEMLKNGGNGPQLTVMMTTVPEVSEVFYDYFGLYDCWYCDLMNFIVIM